MGRPIELTPEVLTRIAKLVEKGNYVEAAADHEGFDTSHVRKLLREGARELRRMAIAGATDPDPRLERAVSFARQIKRARAKAEIDDVAAIREDGSWQARAWRLERRQPDRWGRRERVEHSGPGGNAIPFVGAVVAPDQLKNLTDEELDALQSIVSKVGTRRTSDPVPDSGGEGPARG
jgi:hypothetical protein